jgi:hypothetical protein
MEANERFGFKDCQTFLMTIHHGTPPGNEKHVQKRFKSRNLLSKILESNKDEEPREVT